MENVIELFPPKNRLTFMLSTTSGWNPGDDWIRMGCKNLISRALYEIGHKQAPNYVYYNRNPDLMTNRRISDTLDKNLAGNYVTNIDSRNIDCFVACGTPEWSHKPHENFHKMVLKSKKPYIVLGVGTTNRYLALTKLDKEALSRPNTYIFTRSDEAAQDINKELGIVKALPLPCPAMFCTLAATQKYYPAVQVPQTISGKHALPAVRFNGIAKDIPVIAERWEEWRDWTNAGFDVEYSPEPLDLLMRIGQYDCVYTTRLHGAIAAIATGSAAVIVNKGDFRIETAAKMFGLPVVADYADAFNTAPVRLNENLKWNTWKTYVTNIAEILRDVL